MHLQLVATRIVEVEEGVAFIVLNLFNVDTVSV